VRKKPATKRREERRKTHNVCNLEAMPYSVGKSSKSTGLLLKNLVKMSKPTLGDGHVADDL